MASAQVESDRRSTKKLMHLEFMRILVINVLILATNLYVTAKQNSGSLKSTVSAAENAFMAVFGPFYDRFKGIPIDLLFFFDNKVDQTAQIFEEHAPAVAKNVVMKAQEILETTAQIAKDLAEETQVSGPRAAAARAGKISQHIAVRQLAVVWYKVNQYETVHGVSKMAIPIAANCSDKYNSLVKSMRGKGYNVFGYTPLIPVKLMAKAYKQVESAERKKTREREDY